MVWRILEEDISGGKIVSKTERREENPWSWGRLEVISVNSTDQMGTTPKSLLVEYKIQHATSDAWKLFNFISNKDFDIKLWEFSIILFLKSLSDSKDDVCLFQQESFL